MTTEFFMGERNLWPATPLIAITQVKNDAWIMTRWLQRTAEFADGIVIIDDGSTDGTYDLIRAAPKVVHVKRNKPGTPWRILANRHYLYDYARKLGAAWVCELDSDDILDVRFAAQRDELLSRPGVGRYWFQEITLWRSNQYYRVDKPNQYMRPTGCVPHLIRMNPRLRWRHPTFASWKHFAYAVIKKHRLDLGKQVSIHLSLCGIEGESVPIPLVKLHYHFVDWDEAWKKHLTYAVHRTIETSRPRKKVDEFVAWATSRLDETGLQLAPVKPEWEVL